MPAITQAIAANAKWKEAGLQFDDIVEVTEAIPNDDSFDADEDVAEEED